MDRHWTEELFIEKASLFKPALEARIESAEGQVEELQTIFNEQEVPKDGMVLDIACGIGRHSTVLAQRGYHVIGVDLSPTYIEEAERRARDLGVEERCEFMVGDMREIGGLLEGYERKFSATINMFTSLGYYDDETDRNIVEQLSRLSAERGVLVIETVNRDYLIRHFRARDWSEFPDELMVLEERELDLEGSRLRNVWRYYRHRGEDLEHSGTIEFSHRIYSLHELRDLVNSNGWRFQAAYSRHEQEPVTFDSFRILLVATKA